MKKICAWCNKVLKEDDDIHLLTLSHGICPECYAQLSTKIKNDLSKRELNTVADKLNPKTI